MSIITLERYELIQFTKVFFCTRSCSSEKISKYGSKFSIQYLLELIHLLSEVENATL